MIPLALFRVVVPFVVCAALVPVVRKLSVRWGLIDRPGPLKIHSRPVPRLGGVAAFAAISGGTVFIRDPEPRASAYLFAALGLVWLAGLADDLRSVSPYVRLAAQAASGVFLWLGGWRFSIAEVLTRSSGTNLLFVLVLVIAFVNAFNFLDGCDGLAAGVAAIIGVAYGAISRSVAGYALTSSFACCLAGACAGFLPFNWPAASIFLGDSGSTVLGFCVAALALAPPQPSHAPTLLAFAPIILAGLPLVDAALAIIRRLRSGSSALLGDRAHLYDQMLARGWSSRRVALVCYAITMLLGIAAWSGVHIGIRGVLVAWLLSVAGLATVAVWLGALQPERQRVRREEPINFSSCN
jgi:UDP-GlcNAc:undecaprenyl-phosphate GlcNAc-1-phosphate transferase